MLDTAGHCSSFRRDVLHENELASWPQNSPDLSESLALVVNRAQNRSRDHNIRGLIGQIEGLRPARTNINVSFRQACVTELTRLVKFI